MSTIRGSTPLANAIGFTVFQAVGMGMIYPVTYFPILAPISIKENAHALAFLAFCRSFASVWAVTIGISVLQTQLKNRLPPEFTEQFPEGVAIAYSSIPRISTLAEPLKGQIQSAFAESVAVVWKVILGIGGIGTLASIFMRGLPLHTEVDEKWGLEERRSRHQSNVG
ncbi:hypothetical protein EIP86_006011 [Pleurotus ostreatoroseus]|nr:hypothetical protein EIP86_006011 [Pleurotus ostreatoroseus]